MNELRKQPKICVWESSFDILEWAETVPEVVGTQIYVVANGLCNGAKQSETVPKPKCKTIGYTAWEWLMHWRKALKGTVIKSTPDESMTEYKRMLDVRLCK